MARVDTFPLSPSRVIFGRRLICFCEREGGAVVSDQVGDLRDDRAEVKTFYERYSAWLRMRVTRQFVRQDADDILQETWLRLTCYLGEHEVRHPRALLLRIASNLVSNQSAARIRRTQQAEQAGFLTAQPATLPSQNEDLLIKEVILCLPEPLRDVFLLSRLDGLTNAQIGEKLGISPKTVEWRMTRALAHCAAQLRR